MEKWLIIWSPEGRPIAAVFAKDAKDAKRQAPAPYSKRMGEVYVMLASDYVRQFGSEPRIWR